MANAEKMNSVIEMAISVGDQIEVGIPSHTTTVSYSFKLYQLPTQFCDRLYKPFLFVYAIWIPLLQLKFQNEEYSPFNAQGFFCIMSPIALCITLLLFGGMSCAVDLLQNSGMVYKILLNVACFTGVLAHLSLLFVLLFPPKLNLVGYAIIFVLLMVVVAYTFSSHIKSLDKIIRITWKYVKAFGENKLRSQSTTIIPV